MAILRPPNSNAFHGISQCATALLQVTVLQVLLFSPTAADAAPGDRPNSGVTRPVRKLVPGVETTVPMARAESETSSNHPVIELIEGVPDLEWQPQETAVSKTLYSKAKSVIFRRGVWQFQFTYKPPRMIQVDIPQADGKMKTKVIWYIVYRVTNPGGHLTPVQGPSEEFHEGQHRVQKANSHKEMLASIGPHRFVPTFLLRTFDTGDLKVNKKTVQYTDQIIPVARRAIYKRERPNCSFDEFYDTVQISRTPIDVSTDREEKPRWGVVTWMDIDPKTDFFTVQIMGLTNAYLWADPAGAFKPNDPPAKGRRYIYKTLQLNFYRPGDAIDQREEEIKLGVEDHPKYQWLFRAAPTTYVPVHPRS